MLTLMMKNTGTACIIIPIQASVVMMAVIWEWIMLINAKTVPKSEKWPSCKAIVLLFFKERFFYNKDGKNVKIIAQNAKKNPHINVKN